MKDKRTALDAMRRRVKKIAFEANLYDNGMCDTPLAQKRSIERKRLMKAIKELEDEQIQDLLESRDG